VTISEVRVLHAKHTRRGFLERIVKPLLSANNDAPFTLAEAAKEIESAGRKLEKLGWSIFIIRLYSASI
jgi:outer membrane protein insertion porin family